jgi:hypothetical protein
MAALHQIAGKNISFHVSNIIILAKENLLYIMYGYNTTFNGPKTETTGMQHE